MRVAIASIVTAAFLVGLTLWWARMNGVTDLRDALGTVFIALGITAAICVCALGVTALWAWALG